MEHHEASETHVKKRAWETLRNAEIKKNRPDLETQARRALGLNANSAKSKLQLKIQSLAYDKVKKLEAQQLKDLDAKAYAIVSSTVSSGSCGVAQPAGSEQNPVNIDAGVIARDDAKGAMSKKLQKEDEPDKLIQFLNKLEKKEAKKEKKRHTKATKKNDMKKVHKKRKKDKKKHKKRSSTSYSTSD